ncbi:iron ABC transporter substrate-binding protein [Rufibacter immobilis]|uniref:Iron ABC transporter substrate-binding protein n=1 Tax=Rufibacter immobilis TaxID=1348778 RepID=A0A3M9MX85_9BACT|nr:helical backbone metal receptor [Rufibacter immobilis]RNI29378.1 iron ABC transporter substrate-binding protein [Rufibacter immobilis]
MNKAFAVKFYGLLSLWRLLLVLCVPLLLFGCEAKKTAVPATDAAVHTVTDDLGRKVTLPVQPTRIMGLDASMTEMLYAVADTGTIVGRTQHCDYPNAVLSKPVVNNYPMDYERLLFLKPQVVFATEGIISAEVAAQVQKMGIPVYFQAYDSVSDVLRGLRDLGKLLKREEQARNLVDSLTQKLQALSSDTAQQRERPKVLAIIWKDPIYVFGRNTIFTDKLRYIGADNAVPEVFAQQSPALTREYILKINPDVLVGGTFEEFEKTFFTLYPELRRIKAYQQKRIYSVTDNLMSRTSPRVVESVAELKALLR